MTRGPSISGMTLALAVLVGSPTSSLAQSADGGGRPGRDQLPRPVYRVTQQPADAPQGEANNNSETPKVAANNAIPMPNAGVSAPEQHPLVPALQVAYGALNNIRANIKDYSCTMMKKERIGGKLGDPEFMFLKVRNEPFSVYMYFLGPEKMKGQEVLYEQGKNGGNMIAHGVGLRKIAGTVQLPPNGTLAMAGQRYPITEIGIYNLTKRLIEVAEKDKNFGECEVKFFKGASINKRPVTVIQVTHPVPRKNFIFHVAKVFVDDELNIPVRYEAWDWPEKPGGPPLLIEEYTYMDVKINNGFTDADFSENNTSYNFH
jgi:hypothetical protein